MKNNRGFTLIEILAVIVILSIIALLTVPVINKNIKNSKNNLSNVQLNNIKEASKSWASDNPFKLPDNGDKCYLNYSYLVNNGYLENDMADPKTNIKYSDNNLKIEIHKNENSNEINYNVEFNNESFNINEFSPKCYE